jgi:hypothetical protein
MLARQHRTFNLGDVPFMYIPDGSDDSPNDIDQEFYSILCAGVDTRPKRRFDTGSTIESCVPDGDEPNRGKRSCKALSEEEQDARMAICGIGWTTRIDPFTDTATRGKDHCKILRCPICSIIFGKKIRDQIERALVGNKLVLSIMPHDAATQLLHQFSNNIEAHADNYLRLPQPDGTDYIFAREGFLDTVLLSPRSFTSDDLDSIDWPKVQMTPRGNAKSGKLGLQPKVVKERDPDDAVVITRQIWTPPEAQQKVEQALLATMAKTFTYDPHTLSEVKYYSRAKIDVLLRELDKLDVKYKVFKDVAYGNLRYIDWISNKYHRLPDLVDRGLITQKQLDAFIASLDPVRVSEMEKTLAYDPDTDDFYD